MSLPYRQAAPRPSEPVPMIPFRKKCPTAYAVLKQIVIGVSGVAGLAGIAGVLWLIGLAMRAIGFVSPADTSPNILIGLLGFMILLIVGISAVLTYMLGVGLIHLARTVHSKFSDND